jgi:hypothetical protein
VNIEDGIKLKGTPPADTLPENVPSVPDFQNGNAQTRTFENHWDAPPKLFQNLTSWPTRQMLTLFLPSSLDKAGPQPNQTYSARGGSNHHYRQEQKPKNSALPHRTKKERHDRPRCGHANESAEHEEHDISWG